MARTRSTAGGRPAWLKDMYDIIDGKYDNDTDKMGRLLDAARKDVGEKGFVFTCSSPAMATKAVRAVRQAAEHRVELLEARGQALKAQYEEIEAEVQHKREVRDKLAKSLEEARKKGQMLREQVIEKLIENNSGKKLYQRLGDGEFNRLHYTLFFEILERGCEEEADRLDYENRYEDLFSQDE